MDPLLHQALYTALHVHTFLILRFTLDSKPHLTTIKEMQPSCLGCPLWRLRNPYLITANKVKNFEELGLY